MNDRLDSRIRELTYRLMYMAPEAPPFPEESMTTLQTPSRGPRRPVLAWAAAALGALVLVGVPVLLLRSSETAEPATTVPSSSTSISPTTSVPIDPVRTTEFNVYFFSDDVDGPNGDPGLVAVRRSQPYADVEDPVLETLAAAIGSLVRVGPGDSGLFSSIPEGLENVSVGLDGGGVATVDLPAAFEAGGGTAMMFGRLAQVVFTATQFPEIDAVQFAIEGEVVDVITSEGIVLDGPQRRDGYLDLLQPILVDSPAIGAVVESPVTISGIANVFEATLSYEITTARGEVLADGFTTATCGTGCWGDFAVEVPYTLEAEAAGSVTVFTNSAEDGSRIDIVSYPVTLMPGEGGETPEPTVTTVTAPEPAGEPQLTFLTRVSATEIVADYAEMLTGDEAVQAAFEDGEIGSVEEGIPNDYYIRNQNDQLRTLVVADGVTVVLQTSATGPVSAVEVAMDEWLALYKADGTPWDYEVDEVPSWPEPHMGYFGAGTKGTPYWLTFDADGNVIEIEQQYLP